VFSAIILSSGNLFAGSIDYLSNQSADYMRTFSRNAATEGADIAIYNPSATAYLKKGLYFQYSHQTVFKTYEDDFKTDPNLPAPYSSMFRSENYKTTKETPVLPSGFAIYNGGNWAGYIAASATAGGGSVRYHDGVPLMQLKAPTYLNNSALAGTGALSRFTDGYLKSNSFYPELTLGGSYAINDKISVSLGVRGVYGYKSYNGYANYQIFYTAIPAYSSLVGKTLNAKLDAKEKAFGVGAIIGAEVRPVKDLVLAARYETQTRLNWETEVRNGQNFNGLFVDGKKRRKDLPAMMGLGASYTLFDRLTLTTSFDGFFIGQADQKKDNTNEPIYTDGYDDDYAKFGWELSASAEYALIPDFLKVSAGYMYNDLGGNKNTYNDLDFSLDSRSYGAGAKVSPTKALDITLAGAFIDYVTAKAAPVTTNGTTLGQTTYKKRAYVLSASAEYKIQD
jgi:long-chain fatty acid transport protein